MNKLSVLRSKSASPLKDTLSMSLRRLLYTREQIEYNKRIHRCFHIAQVFLTIFEYEIG